MTNKREKKKKTLVAMFDIYIKKHPDKKDQVERLKDYSFQRIDKCPNIEKNIYCSSCKIHCYSPENREEIKKIMRFSGPRMLFYHPILAIDHLISTIKHRK